MSIPPLPIQLQQLQQTQQSSILDSSLHLQSRSNSYPIPTTIKDTPIPHFTSLHRYLTNEILDSNGGTRSVSKAFEDEGLDEALQREWIDCARRRILIRGLKEFILSGGKGDRDGELWIGVLAWLEMTVDTATEEQQMEEIEELMREEIELFRKLDWRGVLGREVGEYFDRTEGIVRDLALELVGSFSTDVWMGEDEKTRNGYSTSTSTATSSIPGPRSIHSSKRNISTASRRHNPPSLSSSSSSSSTLLQTYTINQTLTTSFIDKLLTNLTTNLSTLLSLQNALLTSQIHRLETFTFSTQTRHLTTRASFLSTVAQGIALKARILALGREREIHASEGMEAMLQRTMEELRVEERGLIERERGLRGLLEGGAGRDGQEMGNVEMERVMGELGREYRNILVETEVVKGDLERLEGEIGMKEGR